MAKRLVDLDTHARELADAAIGWMDSFWDADRGLLWMPDPVPSYTSSIPHVQHHIVRESAWYALGLLLRDQTGDRERAYAAIRTILTYQFDEPDEPYHGTWYRAPEESHPPADPVVWKDYDPNWREFIGTTLAIILIEYAEQLPQSLTLDIDTALRRAVAGTIARNVPASYTNIALMSAFLLCFAADRFKEPAWNIRGEQLATEVHQLFAVHNTFEEYNSPTYYGVDLYALALWRTYSKSSSLRQLGKEMESKLWNDIAQFYHAGMQNLSGPFDRSYGMDLRQYGSLIGMWIALATGRAVAPFPDWRQPFDHSHDFCYAPCFAVLGAQIPAEALPHFTSFQGERQVERVISTQPRRVATAWISEKIMLGGEDNSGSKMPPSQFYPATIYWRRGDAIGWIRLMHTAALDARAAQNSLAITYAASQTHDLDITFQVYPPSIDENLIQRGCWQLPGLTVHVDTNADEPSVTRTDAFAEIHYRGYSVEGQGAIRFTLITDLHSANAPQGDKA